MGGLIYLHDGFTRGHWDVLCHGLKILVQGTWACSMNETIHAVVLFFFPFNVHGSPFLFSLCPFSDESPAPTGGGPMSVKKQDQLPANDPPISCKFDSRAPRGADTTGRRSIGNV